MTSSNSPTTTGSNTLPTASTKPSSPISAPYSTPDKLDRLRLIVESNESEARALALSCLEAVDAPTMSYSDQKAFEAKMNVIYLGYIGGSVRYVPRDITDQRIMQVVSGLSGDPMDSGEMRRALYELFLTTKHKQMTQADRDAMLMIYVERLAAYPAPVVEVVLRNFTSKNPFFPAWSEIEVELRAIMGWRFEMITALRILHRKLKGTNNG